MTIGRAAMPTKCSTELHKSLEEIYIYYCIKFSRIIVLFIYFST